MTASATAPCSVTYCPLCGTGMAFDAPKKTAAPTSASRACSTTATCCCTTAPPSRCGRRSCRRRSAGRSRGPGSNPCRSPTPAGPTGASATRPPRCFPPRPASRATTRATPMPATSASPACCSTWSTATTAFHSRSGCWVSRSDGRHKAYPFSVLARAVDATGELRDEVSGRRLRIRYDPVHRSAEAFDAEGKPWPATMAYWFAWVAFHPQTAVLQAP